MGAIGEIATSDKNPLPEKLAPRFEIRRITDQETHGLWARAIFIHSNIYHSILFKDQYDTATKGIRFKASMEAAVYWVNHMIESGLCFGVYDTQYDYKSTEAKAAGGIYHFNGSNIPDDADSAILLSQMDFPLVSIVMSNDEFVPHEFARAAVLGAPEVVPQYINIVTALAQHDTRDKKDPQHWVPTAKGQVLGRNATSTRADYEGTGLMKAVSHWLMREADIMGFRGIRIDAFHEAVHYVWSNPPKPYESLVVAKCSTKDEVNELPDGTTEKVFRQVDSYFSRIHVFLKK